MGNNSTNTFGALRLKKDTLDKLRDLKVAFEACYLESMTFDRFVEQLISSVEDGDVAVWETYCKIQQKREEGKNDG